MLSKLFAHIKIGSQLWLFGGILALIAFHFIGFYSDDIAVFFVPRSFTYLISGLVFFGVTFGMIDLYNIHFKVTRGNFYTGLILVILWGSIPQIFSIEVSLSMFLLMLLLVSLYQVSYNHKEKAFPHLMNAGIITFLAFLISPLGWLFLLLIFTNGIIHAKISLRGIFLPIYLILFCTVVCYVINVIAERPSFLSEVWTRNLPEISRFDLLEPYKWVYIELVVLFFVSLKQYFIALGKALIIKRKALSFLVMHFLLSLTLSIVFQHYIIYFLGSALFPVAVLFANHLQYIKKYWMREIWIWLLIVLNALPFLL